MSKLEHQIQQEILLRIGGREDVRLFRNNVGTGWTGKMKRLTNGDILIKNPRPLKAGLHKGSADLIGWRMVEINPDMVGKTIAQFLSPEIKKPGKDLEPDQVVWFDVVDACGGMACVWRSVEDALADLDGQQVEP